MGRGGEASCQPLKWPKVGIVVVAVAVAVTVVVSAWCEYFRFRIAKYVCQLQLQQYKPVCPLPPLSTPLPPYSSPLPLPLYSPFYYLLCLWLTVALSKTSCRVSFFRFFFWSGSKVLWACVAHKWKFLLDPGLPLYLSLSLSISHNTSCLVSPCVLLACVCAVVQRGPVTAAASSALPACVRHIVRASAGLHREVRTIYHTKHTRTDQDVCPGIPKS